MNLLLDNVVTDITGKTGMSIIKAILDGEHNPENLAQFRDNRCKTDQATIASSLKGHYRAEHLFSLKQSIEMYEFHQEKIAVCDQEIRNALNEMEEKGDISNLPPTNKRKGKNSLDFDVRSELYRMVGVDLTKIDGLGESGVLKIISETGSDMSAWPSEKHFASWLGLSPNNKVTGGKVFNSKTTPTANRAATAFRMAAFTLTRSKSALGAYLRRQRGKMGAPKAITATAHKIARIFYSMIKNGAEYIDPGQDHYEKQYRSRVLKNLKQKAASLGLVLVENEENTKAGLSVC